MTTLKTHQELYRLIISQLFYDDYQNVAINLTNVINSYPSCPPSNRLLNLVNLGLQIEQEKNEVIGLRKELGIDLDYETEGHIMAPEPGLYETRYITSHKAPCRICCFSSDGQLVATGSADTSIKILDVDRMLAKSSLPPGILGSQEINPQINMETHPVIRTLYDHSAEVTCLEFHPTEQILVSGSKDCTIKFFDYSNPSVKRACKTIQEVEMIRCFALHPSGDYLLVGTHQQTLRLYDTKTFECFVSSVPSDQHTAPITMINYNFKANQFITSSKDGSIKIWDGVTNRCTNIYFRAHDGAEVTSVYFSKNGKYFLSSGKDSVVRLWDINMARCLIAYTGAGTDGNSEHKNQGILNHTEDYVSLVDEKTVTLCTWDSRNAERQRLQSLGHNSAVRFLCHSPNSPAFVSCSDDFRARFWYRKSEA